MKKRRVAMKEKHHANIYDVARSAGCSIATISRALNNKMAVSQNTLVRIETAVKKMNYQPNLNAKNLARKSNNVVAVILPHHDEIHFSVIISAFLAGILRMAESRNYRVMIFPNSQNYDRDKCMGAFPASSIDGAIVLNDSPESGVTTLLTAEDKPVIYVNCTDDRTKHRVNVDNRLGARIATEYLLDQGHRKIAFLNGEIKTLSGRERLKGCEEALKKFKILGRTRDHNLFRSTHYDQKLAYIESLSLLSQRVKPTAIFAASDWMALGVMHAIREKGLGIPGDVSVIGFDDTVFAAETVPALTTVHQPLVEMGETALEGLIEIQEKPDTVFSRVLKPVLVLRESTSRKNPAGKKP